MLYKAEDETVTVYVVAVGIRTEGHAADVDEVAKKLLRAYTEKQNRRRKPPQS